MRDFSEQTIIDTRGDEIAIRRKSVMVVYAIEMALVDLLKKNHIGFDHNLITFGEILQKISKIDESESISNIIKELKYLADTLQLGTIRNNCSHTTRAFPYYQWYRLAAFASDPRLQQLGLSGPIESLACAETGVISDPPDQWLDRLTSPTIPNNLPENEAFEATGLIGRNKEVDLLIKDLYSGRMSIYALVGAGGIGKTSIALTVARQICEDQSPDALFQAVIYVSFKHTELSAKGEIIDRNKQFAKLDQELRSAISVVFPSEFEEIDYSTPEIGKQKVLVILDNVEDIILNDQDSFFNAVNDLPSAWKIIVTSRIPIDGIRSVPVRELGRSAAETLTRKYFESKLGKVADADLITIIVENCNGNPLAIKLTIDRYALGSTLPISISETKRDILAFSFRSLVDALVIEQRDVLEALFVLENATKQDLFDVTSINLDTLSHALSGLARTTLVEVPSTTNFEKYKLTSPIRDLIAREPLRFESRRKYLDILRKRTSEIRSTTTKSILIDVGWHLGSTPKPLYRVGRKLPGMWLTFRSDTSHTLSKNALTYVREFESYADESAGLYGNSPEYFLLRSYSRSILKDLSSAADYARRCLAHAEDSFECRYLLSSILIEASDNEGARSVLSPVIRDIMKLVSEGENIELKFNSNFVREIFGNFFKSYIWNNNYDEVLDFTKRWNMIPVFLQSIFVASRSSALRQGLGKSPWSDPDRRERLLDCVKLIKYAANDLEGFGTSLRNEGKKVLKDLLYLQSVAPSGMVVKAIHELCRVLGEDIEKVIALMNNVNVDLSLRSEQSVLFNAKVHSIHHNYLFSHDDNDIQYFIPASSIEGRAFSRVKIDDELAIIHLDSPSSEYQARRVIRARLIDR